MYNELLEMIYKRSVRHDRSVATVWVWRRNAPRPDVINWSSLSVGTHFGTLFQGRLPMKIEKYLLLVLVLFFLIVIGTYLHKVVH